MVALFRDTKEELKRLQQELLEEDEAPEETEEISEDFPDQDSLEQMLNESGPIPDARVYRNYSNDYGRELRNFASDYRTYNGDKTDTDLEEFSESVYNTERKKPLGCFLFLVLLVLAAAVAVLWCILLGEGGLLH